ncbi:MAG: hypothetical protein ACTSWF_00165 [Candidatus Freyarchaeota archaeon]
MEADRRQTYAHVEGCENLVEPVIRVLPVDFVAQNQTHNYNDRRGSKPNVALTAENSALFKSRSTLDV